MAQLLPGMVEKPGRLLITFGSIASAMRNMESTLATLLGALNRLPDLEPVQVAREAVVDLEALLTYLAIGYDQISRVIDEQ
jgi:hypothetical protein